MPSVCPEPLHTRTTKQARQRNRSKTSEQGKPNDIPVEKRNGEEGGPRLAIEADAEAEVFGPIAHGRELQTHFGGCGTNCRVGNSVRVTTLRNVSRYIELAAESKETRDKLNVRHSCAAS